MMLLPRLSLGLRGALAVRDSFGKLLATGLVLVDTPGVGGLGSAHGAATMSALPTADAVLLVGVNPRVEAPLLNARLRKAWLKGDMEIGLIGEQADLTFDYAYLGAGTQTLAKLPKSAMDFLTRAERPAIIVGAGALGGDAPQREHRLVGGGRSERDGSHGRALADREAVLRVAGRRRAARRLWP